MNEFMLYFIVVLHFVFVLFVVLTPFVGNNYFLILHAVIVPFMMAHWFTNDNNCALTMMEKKLRKNLYGEEPDPNECFTYNLIAPVYDFKKNNNDMSLIIYLVTFGLWGYTLVRLYTNYRDGKLAKLEDLMMF
ncbi:hypothetical protein YASMINEVIRUS_938 [Yasminevirus sp. GU-2018]|uniref:Uncharacterized protein n=1 Tax=Yasminevirus sp. GU-2018 TaxID=2420051 RepID=A0A5K0U9M8_9VIRU|nr:hypothetical protein YASMINEVIRUS_938 [Yasminevirus sp. GU-2018]